MVNSVGVATTTPKPSQMPRRTNPIHHQILGYLTASVPKDSIRSKMVENDKVETVVGCYHAPRYRLAANVSDRNIDIMARRW